MNQSSKRCTKCYQVKPLNCFSRQRTGSLGRKSECKKCQVKANMAYRHTRKANILSGNRCWRCGSELPQERYLLEQQLIKLEKQRTGGQERLPICYDCAMLPKMTVWERIQRERENK